MNMLMPYIVAVALFMETIDATIIVTAIPVIAKDLLVDPIQLKLAIMIYLLTLGLLIPISGWMAERFGSKRIFLSAIFIFVLGSIFCGCSNHLWQLLLGRVIQGVGGAMMLPVANLVVLHAVPKDQLTKVIGYITIPGILGPLLGPFLGGLIVTYFNWRMIFFVNVPIGLFGLLFAQKHMSEYLTQHKDAFDWLGFFLFGTAVTCIVLIIESLGTSFMQYKLELLLLTISITFFYFYLRHARTCAKPMITLALFKIKSYNRYALSLIFFFVTSSGLSLLNPLFLQLALHYSPLLTGLLLCSFGISIIIAKLVNHKYINWLGNNNWLAINYFLVALGIGGIALVHTSTSMVYIILILMMQGFSVSVMRTNFNVILYQDVPMDIMEHATSFGNMLMQLSYCFGTAAVGVLINYFMGSTSSHGEVDVFHSTYLIFLIFVTISAMICFYESE